MGNHGVTPGPLRGASLALDRLRTTHPRAIMGTQGALETLSAPRLRPEHCVSREAVLHSVPGARLPALGPASPEASRSLLGEAGGTWGPPSSPHPRQASCPDPEVPAGRIGGGQKSCLPGPSTLVSGLFLALPALYRGPRTSLPSHVCVRDSGPHTSSLCVPRGCDPHSGLVRVTHGV